jgi:hypothetical protein
MRSNRKRCFAPRRLAAVTFVPPSRLPLSFVTFGAQLRVIIRRLGLDFFLSQFFAAECRSRQGVCKTRPGAAAAAAAAAASAAGGAAATRSHRCTSAAQKRELRRHSALNPNAAAAARGCEPCRFSGCVLCNQTIPSPVCLFVYLCAGAASRSKLSMLYDLVKRTKAVIRAQRKASHNSSRRASNAAGLKQKQSGKRSKHSKHSKAKENRSNAKSRPRAAAAHP